MLRPLWSTALLFVRLVGVPARCSVCLLVSNAKSTGSPPPLHQSLELLSLSLAWLALSVSDCLCLYIQIVRTMDHFCRLLFLCLSVDSHKQAHAPYTQLISSSHTCSSGRTWPCLIVYHAYLFSLHDVTTAYLFSPGLLSHIKMIDSFHSLHIFKLYLISSFVLAC